MSIQSRFMDTVGDGSGSINASVVGSLGTPSQFIIKPEANQILYMSRLLIFIEDSGTLDSGGFGNGTALTNGIVFLKYRYFGLPGEFVVQGFQLEQLPIKKNQEFKALCHDEIFSDYGTGTQSLSWRYTFLKDTDGDPIFLQGANQEAYVAEIRDDLTTKCDALYFRIGCKD